MDNTYVVKLSLTFIAEQFLFSRPTHKHYDPWLLQIANDLDEFNKYP